MNNAKTNLIEFHSHPINLFVSTNFKTNRFKKIIIPSLTDQNFKNFKIIKENIINLNNLLPPSKFNEYNNNNNNMNNIEFNKLQLPCAKDEFGNCLNNFNIIHHNNYNFLILIFILIITIILNLKYYLKNKNDIITNIDKEKIIEEKTEILNEKFKSLIISDIIIGYILFNKKKRKVKYILICN
jgi:hypothetical protein